MKCHPVSTRVQLVVTSGVMLTLCGSLLYQYSVMALRHHVTREKYPEFLRTVDQRENTSTNSNKTLINDTNDSKQILHGSIGDWIKSVHQPHLEMLFLYNKVLSQKHAFNEKNLMSFRNEIIGKLRNNIGKSLFLTQKNSPKGTALRYYLEDPRSKLKLSSKLYNLLPKESGIDTSRSCSVVGNSGNLIGSKCGKQIDSADLVYRCNIVPLKPFAEDAGLKSNVTSMNPSLFSIRYNTLKTQSDVERFNKDMMEYKGFVWGACLSKRWKVPICTKALEKYNNTESKFVLGHPDHYTQIMDYWKSLNVSKRLSTGFYFVTDAIIRCNEINLYGFWPFPHVIDSAIRNVSYHYSNDMKFPGTDGQAAAHSMNEEFSILLQLHLLGVIRLNVGAC